jgi:PadR family transcriptional regulator, regulatory protein AphA
MAELTTTSYAILCLLAVRPWTTYELATQMERSLRDMWPRATSVVYQEPKRLVAAGLARAQTVYTGRRSATVYSISRAGRRAVRRWLDGPGSGPVLEFEALLQIAFADHGTLEQLRANLTAFGEAAAANLASAHGRIDEYAETGGPFPDRLPVISLAARFQLELAELLARWAEWARTEVQSWQGVTPETGARVAPFLTSSGASAGTELPQP